MKEKKCIWTTRFFISVVVFLFCFPLISSAQENEELLHIPGRIEGFGKHFEINDSEYLNVSLSSDEDILVKIESIPEMVMIDIQPSENANSADVTLSGFVPSVTYHKYEDNYHNYVPFIADENGTFSFAQDISQGHLVFIQPRKSTKFINATTGGDCASVGIWDFASKTCTLNKDVNETIQIDSDNITLDGAGHRIDGNNKSNNGIHLDHRTGVVIKNVFVTSSSVGISFYYSGGNRVEASRLEDNNYGIHESYKGGNVYENNIASENKNTGIRLVQGLGGTLNGNVADANLYYGIQIDRAAPFTMKNNLMSDNGKTNLEIFNSITPLNDIDKSNKEGGKSIYYLNKIENETFDGTSDMASFYCFECENINLRNLSLPDGARIVFWRTNNSNIESVISSGKSIGIYLLSSWWDIVKNSDLKDIYVTGGSNMVYNNNFSTDFITAYSSSTSNAFNRESPIGGNYWKRNAPNCFDGDGDGFCDSPYVFSSKGIDYLPHAVPFDYGTAPPPVPAGNSNVLFLPGIKASKLYKKEINGVENQLWTPNYFDNDLEQLALDEDGYSDKVIYTQEVVEEKPVTGGDIYKTFIEKLALLRSSETINDYGVFAYDWRTSVEDVAQGETLYRNETKRALVEVENLADSAKNKKVTIIAHSNGGLLAKAMMLELEKLGKADKVDKIIFVGSPQMGTPLSILSLLYGFNEASPLDILISQRDSRVLAENMPGAYGLLPSEKYFERAGVENPFITFSSDHTRYADFKNAYDESIFGIYEFKQFLTGDGDGRIDPSANEVDLENRLNEKLISEAFTMHERLDAWTPPENVKVIEIAGWGLDTISGVDYAEKEDVKCYAYLGSPVPSCTGIGDYEPVYEPKFTVDGDGTVVAPSALMMEEGASVEKYWVDLYENNKGFNKNRNHSSILEVDSLQEFIDDIIENKDYESALPEFIKDSHPNDYTNAKPRIRMSLYSPLDINISDGVHETGPEIIDDQTIIREEIPNSYYYQFGERKYVGFSSGENVHITLTGYEAGDYTLKLEEVRETAEGEEILAHTTFKNLPVSPETVVSLDIPERGLTGLSNLEVDFDGNGELDYVVAPVPNGEAVLPDTIAPETSVKLAGKPGDDNWHISDVTVELLAEDNAGGTGVAGIKYALNDSEEQDYVSPITISKEGTTSLKYFSIDNTGNREEAKTEIVKIDKTAPEAKLIFNQTEKKFDIVGVDNLSGEVMVIVEEKIIEQKQETKKGLLSRIYAIIKKVNKQKQVVATLYDEAGHKTEITLEKNEFGNHFVNLFPESVSYDGIGVELPSALLQYKWLYDSKKGRYLLFGTHIKNESELIEAHYFPKKNETWIMEKPRELDDNENDDDAERRPAWKKLSGMVVPYLQTEQGKLKLAY